MSSNVTLLSSWWHGKKEKRRQKRSTGNYSHVPKWKTSRSFWLYIHHGTWRDGRNFCGYLILRFFPNRKNSQNIVPANNSNNKVRALCRIGTTWHCDNSSKGRTPVNALRDHMHGCTEVVHLPRLRPTSAGRVRRVSAGDALKPVDEIEELRAAELHCLQVQTDLFTSITELATDWRELCFDDPDVD